MRQQKTRVGGEAEVPGWLAEVAGVAKALAFFTAEQRRELVSLLERIRRAAAQKFEVLHPEDFDEVEVACATIRQTVARVRREEWAGGHERIWARLLADLDTVRQDLHHLTGRRSLSRALKVELLALLDVLTFERTKMAKGSRSGGTRGAMRHRYEWAALLWGAATGVGASLNWESMKKFAAKPRNKIAIDEDRCALVLRRVVGRDNQPFDHVLRRSRYSQLLSNYAGPSSSQ